MHFLKESHFAIWLVYLARLKMKLGLKTYLFPIGSMQANHVTYFSFLFIFVFFVIVASGIK